MVQCSVHFARASCYILLGRVILHMCGSMEEKETFGNTWVNRSKAGLLIWNTKGYYTKWWGKVNTFKSLFTNSRQTLPWSLDVDLCGLFSVIIPSCLVGSSFTSCISVCFCPSISPSALIHLCLCVLRITLLSSLYSQLSGSSNELILMFTLPLISP